MIVSITTDRKAGGLANSLVSYSKALDLIGQQHLVLIPETAPVIKTLETLDNVETIKLNKTKLVFHIVTRFLFSKKLKNALKDCDLILVHNAKFMKHFKRFKHKVAYVNHTGKLRYTVHEAFNIFITSAGLNKFLQAYPNNKSTNKVISHGFDLSENSSQSSAISSEDSDKTLNIMSAGRFLEKKGFQTLIDAASILKKTHANIHIYLYGEGPFLPNLKQQAKSLALENVIFMGWHANLHEEFNKYDAYCSPSLMESFGLATGEAMMHGRPVIATKTDGALEMFPETTETKTEDYGGILVDFSAPEQLAHAMLRLGDDALRKQMGENAKKNIRDNFSLERLSQDLEAFIAEVNQHK